MAATCKTRNGAMSHAPILAGLDSLVSPVTLSTTAEYSPTLRAGVAARSVAQDVLAAQTLFICRVMETVAGTVLPEVQCTAL